MLDRLHALHARSEEITTKLADPAVTGDPAQLAALSKELSRLTPLVRLRDRWMELNDRIEEARDLVDSPDPELAELAADELATAEEELTAIDDDVRERLVGRDPDDERNAIVELRAGTGGDEAGLFAKELMRMYMRLAERRGLKTEVMSTNETGIGGLKEGVLRLVGDGAYGLFRHESGVHRVQRVPVTEASGRIHTSAASVAVLPEADAIELDIPASDIRVDVFRSSGHGGQSVNTTDSAVRVTHLPTGTSVSMQDEKSQLQNRAKAMAILRARLLQAERERQADERGELRRGQIGSGDRSEKIRTYNFPQDRVTDHRIGLTLRNLDGILDGDLDRLVDALQARAAEERVKAAVS
ncbi:MAG: peptide chain release factor 1 [Chloroflexota bacterium]|nr:peptide chain release factor 1 [Chloroflexota bacterium]